MVSIKVSMLTMIDNKYDPFTQYDAWEAEDIRLSELKSIRSCNSLMGLMARTSPELSPIEQQEEIDSAINNILKFDFMGLYKKVSMDM